MDTICTVFSSFLYTSYCGFYNFKCMSAGSAWGACAGVGVSALPLSDVEISHALSGARTADSASALCGGYFPYPSGRLACVLVTSLFMIAFRSKSVLCSYLCTSRVRCLFVLLVPAAYYCLCVPIKIKSFCLCHYLNKPVGVCKERRQGSYIVYIKIYNNICGFWQSLASLVFTGFIGIFSVLFGIQKVAYRYTKRRV